MAGSCMLYYFIYSMIQKEGLNFVSLYFKTRTSDKYDVNYIWLHSQWSLKIRGWMLLDLLYILHISGNMDVLNWVHLFKSRCISTIPKDFVLSWLAAGAIFPL